MNTLRIIIPSILILFITIVKAQNTDNTYPYEYDGKDYEVVLEMKTFEEAAADAVTRGGHLIHVNDASENSAMWVASFL